MSKSSLKENLLVLIKQKGEISYGDFVTYVLDYGAKCSAAERRMRELIAAPNSRIEAIMAKSRKGTMYVGGYKLKDYVSMPTRTVMYTEIPPRSQVAPQEEKYPKLPKFTFKEE